jgi:hypothetical protein
MIGGGLEGYAVPRSRATIEARIVTVKTPLDQLRSACRKANSNIVNPFSGIGTQRNEVDIIWTQ